MLRGRKRLTLAGQAEPGPHTARGSSGNLTSAVSSLTGRPLAAEGRTARRVLHGTMDGVTFALNLFAYRRMQRETGALVFLGD